MPSRSVALQVMLALSLALANGSLAQAPTELDLFQEAVAAVRAHDFERYEQAVARLKELHPGSQRPGACALRGMALYQHGHEAEAFEELWRAREQMNYAQAWSFVHFLASSASGIRSLREYFAALRDGADAELASREAFGSIDMARLERDWSAHLATLAKGR